jgi:predicted AAA+ superfamily ATPase
MKARWPAEPTTVVLDEIHKYRKWKRFVKGEFDKHRDRLKIIVTGNARLDVYRKGGDSLQGRYHHYRLHPFTLAELGGAAVLPAPFAALGFPAAREDLLDVLVRFGGFPEPALAQSERVHRRWQKERIDRFFREDVRDLEAVREMSSIQLLSDLIPGRVGSPLSLNSLREDLDASHKAVSHWMDVLERLYFVFRLRPFTAKLIRSLKKGPKYYLWDWSMVEDAGARFENLVASHLLKFCHLLEDAEGHRAELHYLRDADQREVDFLVTVNRKPWFAVEAKLGDTEPAPALRYYGTRLAIPHLFQVVRDTDKDFESNGVRVLPAAKFLAGLV